ncbi:MAG: hypothetical protein V8Q84_09160 [Bilophila sp.]
MGQRVRADFLPEDIVLKGEAGTCKTSSERIFAGGDALRGPSTLIDAVADGRRGAEAILEALGLASRVSDAPADDRRPDIEGLALRRARRFAPTTGARLLERVPGGCLGFEPCLRPLTPEEAMEEARRCLQCDFDLQ